MPERSLCRAVGKLKGPARGRLRRRMASRKLELNPRVPNGRMNQGGGDRQTAQPELKHIKLEPPPQSGEKAVAGDAQPPLQLHGARTEPSALLKVEGNVYGTGGTRVPVQPMIDSGASGMGFVDPAFVQRCGVKMQPSSRRITLADGSEVRASGEVTLTYALDARSCKQKEKTPPVRFTSTFIVTPLAPHELILGMGWLEQHHALIGFRERSIQLRVDGAGKQHCIRPLARCNDDGSLAAEAAPLQLKAITQKRATQADASRGRVEQLYAVLIRPARRPATRQAAVEAAPIGQ